jgi:hypothetical protein
MRRVRYLAGADISLEIASAREMPVLPRYPDADMCARTARGAEHELLHGPPGVFIARRRSRSQAVDRYRKLV